MTNMRFLAFCLLLLHYPVSKNGFSKDLFHADINTTNLMWHYFNACGFGYLCDETIYKDFGHVKMRFPNCPPCDCDELCYITGSCCPDKYFNARNQLRSIYLMDGMYKEGDIKMEFIDKCPKDAPASEYQDCERDRSEIERLFLPPCTSLRSKKIYWNKHCALCHGEREGKLEFWTLYMSGNCREELFYLSSWDKILKFVILQKCSLFHSPSDLTPTLAPHDDAPNRCTDESDQDITNACMSSYNLKYRRYRNIFCAMCNPFVDPDKSALVSSCHPDGPLPTQTHLEWKTLNTLCNKSVHSNLSYPYQNVFCYLCNMRFSARKRSHGNVMHYADGSMTVQDVTGDAFDVFVSNVNITNTAWIFDMVNTSVSDIEFQNVSTRNSRPNDEVSLNISHLARLYYAYSVGHFCNISILSERPTEYELCKCDSSCIFGFAELCCFETMLKTPFTCLETSNRKSYLVISGCNETLKAVNPPLYMAREHLCQTELDFPITVNRISYRNIFCLLCNDANIDLGMPWGFRLRCQAEIPLLYHMNIIPNIIREARKRRCNVDFDTSMAYECLNQFTLCTYFGDHNIVDACEQTGFKFLRRGVEFCDMCRHTPLRFPRKSNCTPKSRYFRPDLRDQCEKFPEVNRYDFGEYKNRFCFECNAFIDPPKISVHVQQMGTSHLFLEIRIPIIRILSHPATPSQIGAPLCYPGRAWSGQSCEPLLQYVTSATYVLNMLVDIHISISNGLSSVHMLPEIKSEIKKHVMWYMNEKRMPVHSCNVHVYPVDSDDTSSKGRIIKTILVIKFELEDFDRTNTEKNLLDVKDLLLGFKNQIRVPPIEFEITRSLCPLPVSIPEVNTLYLPEFLSYLNLIKTLHGSNIVSELLFCEHKIIQSGYHNDSISHSIKLDNGLSIPLGQFKLLPDGAIQICKSYNLSHPSIQTISYETDSASVLIRYISLGLSACSFLVINLMIYFGKSRSLSLPYLRTMLLFMILEDALFILTDYVVPSQTVCCVYGVLRHYCALLLALSLFFYGKSVVNELEYADKGDNPIEHFYRVTGILPIAIIVANSICLKIIVNDFGYCNGKTVCFLHIFLSVVLSLYCPCFVILIALCAEFYKAQFRIDRVLCGLFVLLSMNVACGWIFDSLYLLKHVDLNILKSILYLCRSAIITLCMSYSYCTSRRQTSSQNAHKGDQINK